MKKLDRLVWAAGFAFRAFGVSIGVRVNSAELLNSLYPHLPVGWTRHRGSRIERLYSIVGGGPTSSSGTRRFNLIYGDTRLIARTLQLEEAYDILESDMDSFLAQRSRRGIFVHAGAVSWKGRVIVIPGPSQSGKTTLVKALIEAGAEYYSDEYAVLDGRGRVHPFPRRLSIRGNSSRSRLSAESIGSPIGAKPLPIGLIALTRYKSGTHWKPRKLSPGKGALGMLANTIMARSQPAKTLENLGVAVRKVPVFAGSRGEADETAQSILHFFEAS